MTSKRHYEMFINDDLQNKKRRQRMLSRGLCKYEVNKISIQRSGKTVARKEK